ncbi:MAG TPA: TAXI family TRAP transporter solute-binding subunit [Bacillota bacterium]|nr:TAXI family TRAP transporter solute-binding subunit [Bacillota bacterium]HOA15179.1 TAXI family TRAP transporter solute-binding subunit [Bacillota bacterium]HOG53257.1 TAXI family TRAP transporter solute-binding subunit [Bacillota bacterium]
MKRALLIGLALIMSFSMIAMAATDLTLGTGGVAGTYFPLGGVIAGVINKYNPNYNMNAVSTGASVANLNGLKAGDFDLIIVQNDTAYFMYNGSEGSQFAGAAYKGFGAICNLYPEPLQIVVRYDSDIKTFADLKGKRVSVGDAGSGTEVNARQLFEVYGMDYKKDTKYEYSSFAQASAKFKDGGLDAFFVTGGVPTAAITETAVTHKIRILSIEDAKIAEIQKKLPFLAATTIPAKAYGANQPDGAKTVAVMAILVASNNVNTTVVYDITKTIFEKTADIAAGHAKGASIKLAEAIDGLGAPLHPGALKYFKEKGLVK